VQQVTATIDGTAAAPARIIPPLSPAQPSCRPTLQVVAPGHPERPALEAMIAGTYAEKHGARICSFMPTLLALKDSSGSTRAVAGIRPAAHDTLFLEQYLDDPVEQALAVAIGQPVARTAIAEVGNLAARECRSACRLALLLAGWLGERGHEWVVFTATNVVRGILQGLGSRVVELAQASAARLRQHQDDWGRYYNTDPRVMAAYLPAGATLTRHGFRQRRTGLAA
jgi:hypothetical protein